MPGLDIAASDNSDELAAAVRIQLPAGLVLELATAARRRPAGQRRCLVPGCCRGADDSPCSRPGCRGKNREPGPAKTAVLQAQGLY
ncbi:MAG: hypothetical protein CEE41_05320 [Hadesarchaea archaeon B3_Hades]|nr:MAG: hypothetical protein CEE41_05320 [Hadesarchaea archaeon B3_Hades]